MSYGLPLTTAAEEADRNASIAVLPVGSYEQHGAHLPLSTDTLIAGIIAEAIAEAYGLMLLPPVTIACSHEHAAWRGTVSISATTLTHVINDISRSLAASGVDKLLIVNGHGGNYVLSNIVQEASTAGPRMALFPGGSDWRDAREAGGLTTTSHDDMHAGELETSILLHAMPDAVRPGYETADHDASDRPHLLTLGMQAYTATGVIGRPSLSTAGKGKAVLDALVKAACTFITALSGTTTCSSTTACP